MNSRLSLPSESPARSRNGRANRGDASGATNQSSEYVVAPGVQKSAVALGNENTSGALLARPPSEGRSIDALVMNAHLFDATAKLTILRRGMEEATGQDVITTSCPIAMAKAAWRCSVMFTMRR